MAKSSKSSEQPRYLNFDKPAYKWHADVDYRKHSEQYLVGKGEQGVLICEPYKSEILPHWRFKDPEVAIASSTEITKLFEKYLAEDDFVGADMARKFLQMGFTRARRYANYKGGIKYDKEDGYKQNKKGTGEALKAQSAKIFFDAWKKAEANEVYAERKKDWKARVG